MIFIQDLRWGFYEVEAGCIVVCWSDRIKEQEVEWVAASKSGVEYSGYIN